MSQPQQSAVRLLGFGVVACLFLAACGSGDESATDSTEPTLPTTTTLATTTQPPTTISTLPPTTTATEPPTTTTAVPATVCPADPLGQGADTAPVAADVNGDNELDTAFARRIEDNWFVVVEFGGGGSASLLLTDSDPVSNVRIIGPVDFTGAGTQELAVSVGSGAYTEQIGFVRARDCELLRLAFETDAPAGFLSGASVGNFSGILCAPGLVEQYEFTLNADAAELTYGGGYTPFTLNGDTFVKGEGDQTVLSADELASIKTFDCFGLTL